MTKTNWCSNAEMIISIPHSRLESVSKLGICFFMPSIYASLIDFFIIFRSVNLNLYKYEAKFYIRTMSKRWMENIPAYFHTYLKLVDEEDISEALKNTWSELTFILEAIDENKANYAYEIGKWTIKEMLVHMIDTERIFQYRSLAIARGEMNELPGFDHNNYVMQSRANVRSLDSIIEEFHSVRNASLTLYENIDESRLKLKGMANGLVVQPVQYGYITSGHVRHHIQVIKDKYL